MQVTPYAIKRLLSGKKHKASPANNHLLIESEVDLTVNKDTAGLYVCAACGTALFEAAQKFEAHCGFPSFWLHIGDNVKFNQLNTYGRERIQLLCNHCGHHLGHLFPNKQTPTGVRYCINKDSISWKEE